MSESINLLDPNKNSASGFSLKRIHTMRFLAMSFLFLVSVSSVILFILVALSPLPQLQRQEQSLKLTLAESRSAIAQHALVNERIDTITTVIDSRVSLEETITLIQQNLPSNVAVSALKADNHSVSVTVESASLDALDTFVKTMTDLGQDENGFSQVTMSNMLTDNTRNTYTVTLTMVVTAYDE